MIMIAITATITATTIVAAANAATRPIVFRPTQPLLHSQLEKEMRVGTIAMNSFAAGKMIVLTRSKAGESMQPLL